MAIYYQLAAVISAALAAGLAELTQPLTRSEMVFIGVQSEFLIMSDMTELIVLLLSPITALATMMFVNELRGPPK